MIDREFEKLGEELEASRQNEMRLTAQLARAADLIEDLQTQLSNVKTELDNVRKEWVK